VASLSLEETARGLSPATLDALVESIGEGAVSLDARREAFARFEDLAPPDIPSGRYWKIDLAKQRYDDVVVQLDSYAASPSAAHVWSLGSILKDGDPELRATFDRVFRSTLDLTREKFAALTLAFQNCGAFVYVPAGIKLSEPIELTYVARGAGIFPYTVVLAGEGSECTVMERIVLEGSAPFVCAVAEVVAEPGARVDMTSIVEPGAGRIFTTRRAKANRDSRLRWSVAELGGDLVVDSLHASMEERGAECEIGGVFFAAQAQHVALETQVDHTVGETRSETIVKGAATERGQGRYVGNIRIQPHAHQSDASLRDDSLLLSKSAHIDSIPALEIAANDVKAFHGATVGAIDEDEIFYAQSRGIPRREAERMIALGFFEPALARFPEGTRDHVRAALEQKLPETL
jgi:Fe-S cluster assembly protein SufD